MKLTPLLCLSGLCLTLLAGCSSTAGRRSLTATAKATQPHIERSEYTPSQPRLLPPQGLESVAPSGRPVKSVGFRSGDSNAALCGDGTGVCAESSSGCGDSGCPQTPCGEPCGTVRERSPHCGGLIGKLLTRRQSASCGEECTAGPPTPRGQCGLSSACGESACGESACESTTCGTAAPCGEGCGPISSHPTTFPFGHTINKPQLAEPMTDPVLEAPMPPGTPPEPDQSSGAVPQPPAPQQSPDSGSESSTGKHPEAPKSRRPWPTRGTVTDGNIDPPMWPRLNRQARQSSPPAARQATVVAPTLEKPVEVSPVSLQQTTMPQIIPRQAD